MNGPKRARTWVAKSWGAHSRACRSPARLNNSGGAVICGSLPCHLATCQLSASDRKSSRAASEEDHAPLRQRLGRRARIERQQLFHSKAGSFERRGIGISRSHTQPMGDCERLFPCGSTHGKLLSHLPDADCLVEAVRLSNRNPPSLTQGSFRSTVQLVQRPMCPHSRRPQRPARHPGAKTDERQPARQPCHPPPGSAPEASRGIGCRRKRSRTAESADRLARANRPIRLGSDWRVLYVLEHRRADVHSRRRDNPGSQSGTRCRPVPAAGIQEQVRRSREGAFQECQLRGEEVRVGVDRIVDTCEAGACKASVAVHFARSRP